MKIEKLKISNRKISLKDIIKQNFFLIVMSASILLRFYYISFISVYDMQHDVGRPGENYGHLGYISYLLLNNHLPDFDVREAFQFWHPPLHHYISAIFLKIVWAIFPGQWGNYESIQILSLIYISISLWVIWKLLNMWGFKEKTIKIVFALMAFQPTFIILSGSVNNDALCIMLSILALYLSLLWYRKPELKIIIFAAMAVGLGMSSKGTTAVVAFPMAFVFLMGLIKYKRRVLGQLILFGLIALPLGMWWYLRNYILFKVPINYIYRTSTDAIGYLGNIPKWKRVLDFDIRRFSFSNIYVQFEGRFTEINPIIALLKSAVYAQSRFNYNIYIRIVVYPLVFIWTFWVILSIYSIPSFLTRRKELVVEALAMLVLFIVQFISYYSFCLEYPYVWSMDIRYAVLIILCHGMLLAEFLEVRPKWEKIIKYLLYIFILITCLCFFMFSFTDFGG